MSLSASACLSADSDYENVSCSADVHVEIMAYQSVIRDDYKGQVLSVIRKNVWRDSLGSSKHLYIFSIPLSFLFNMKLEPVESF